MIATRLNVNTRIYVGHSPRVEPSKFPEPGLAQYHAQRREPVAMALAWRTSMRRAVLLVTAAAALSVQLAAQSPRDWPTVGNDPGGMKYSPLTQITPANVARLTTAWTYDTGA